MRRVVDLLLYCPVDIPREQFVFQRLFDVTGAFPSVNPLLIPEEDTANSLLVSFFVLSRPFFCRSPLPQDAL